MVDATKLAAFAFLLIGITFLITGIGFIYALITVGGVIETLSSMASTMSSYQIPSFTKYMIAGWFFAILQTATGLMALIAGIAILVIKEEPS